MHEGRVIARAVAQHGKGDELKALRRRLVQPTRAEAVGQRAAAIYTLLGTAKLNRLDPELYLRHVLERRTLTFTPEADRFQRDNAHT
jgi:hypothetical protein